MASTEVQSNDDMCVVDLDELFLKRAKKLFESGVKSRLEKTFKTSLHWEELNKTLDYSNFVMETQDVKYRPVQPLKNSNNVVFKTTYSNTTSATLKYTLNIERTTRNITTLRLSKGLCHSGNVGLKLKLPGDICELESGYSRELTMQRDRETSREEEMVWSANTEIQVPPNTDTTMELVVDEHEYDGHFDCSVKLSGSVMILVCKGESEVCRIDDTNLYESLPQTMGFIFDQRTKTMTYKTSGNCNIRKGLKQSIKLSECPNTETSHKSNSVSP